MNERVYTKKDMVRIGCQDCKGCSDCCRGMGDSIILNPYDVYRLSSYLGKKAEELLSAGLIAPHMEEGILVFSIVMDERDACPFLNDEGRCGVHAERPGICRLFPLGRQYSKENESYRVSYFVLQDACPQAKTKEKISKWIGIFDMDAYEEYLGVFHSFQKWLGAYTKKQMAEQKEREALSFLQQVITVLYLCPYDAEKNFWQQSIDRMQTLKKSVHI